MTAGDQAVRDAQVPTTTRKVRNRGCARGARVSAAGEVQLLHGWDPTASESPSRFSVGGVLDDAEVLLAAGVRGVQEELGAFDLGERHPVQDQSSSAVRGDLAADQAHVAGPEPIQAATIDHARWWTPEDLLADDGVVSETLPVMMRAAVDAVR